MAALVVVPNRRNRDGQRSLRGRQHKRQFQRFRELPGHDIARIPIDNGHEIAPSVGEPDIRNIDTPHVIRIRRGHPLQQVRVNGMGRMPRTGVGTWRKAPNAHFPHIPLHAFPIDGMAFLLELDRHAPRPIKRSVGVDFIDPVLERHLDGVRPDGPVIQARPGEAE